MPSSLELPSVERLLTLLEKLLEQPRGATLNEMLEMGISRSTLFALLRDLKARGYVVQPERGRYLPGPRLLSWRGRSNLSSDLQVAFYQEVLSLALDETLALALPLEQGAVLIAQYEPQTRLHTVFPPHFRFPAESAAAQALSLTPEPSIQESGYALAHAEGLLEVAFPVCADGTMPYAALILSAPAFRWDAARLKQVLPRLREIAARLSYRLGATHYGPWQFRPSSPPQERLLTAEEIDSFLRAPWVARLACLRPDGNPHVVPLWHEWDERYFYVVAWQGSLWADYLLQQPRLSLSIDEPWPPLRRVIVRGYAQRIAPHEISGGLTGLLERLRRRYVGPGGMLPGKEARPFRIFPESMHGWQGI